MQTQIVNLESLEPVLKPEYAFGEALPPEKVEGLVDYVSSHLKLRYPDERDPKDVADSLKGEDGYTPELGAYVLLALKSEGSLPRGVFSDDDIWAVAENEESFQRTMGIFTSSGNAALNSPKLYELFAGKDMQLSELERFAVDMPQSLLGASVKIDKDLPDEESSKLLNTAYEAYKEQRADVPMLSALSNELIDAVGRDRVVAEVRERIELNADYIGKHPDGSTIQHLMNLGIMTGDEGFALAREIFLKEAPVVPNSYLRAIELTSNPQNTLQQTQQDLLNIVARKEVSDMTVGEQIRAVATTQFSEIEKDTDFLKRYVDVARKERGDQILLYAGSFLDEVVSKEELGEIAQKAFNDLGDMESLRHRINRLHVPRYESDLSYEERTEIEGISTLLQQLTNFTETLPIEDRKTIITGFATAMPEYMVRARRFMPYEGREDGLNDFLEHTALDAISLVKDRDILYAIDEMKLMLPNNLQAIKDRVLEACLNRDEGSVSLRNLTRVASIFDESELFDVFNQTVATVTDKYEFSDAFDTACKMFGAEQAKRFFMPLFEANGDFVSDILSSYSSRFTAGELMEIVEVAKNAGNEHQVLYSMSTLAFLLPREEVALLLDGASENQSPAFMRALDIAGDVIGLEETARLLEKAVKQNPAAVLRDWRDVPKGLISSRKDVLDYMTQDPRVEHAPKYFKRALRRMENSEETTAFIITVSEAASVYAKLGTIGSQDGGYDTLDRLVAQTKAGARGELDVVSMLALIAKNSSEQLNAIESVEAAKLSVVSSLFEQLAIDQEVTQETVDALEQTMGSIVPFALYAESMQQHWGDNTPYLQEIAQAVLAGEYESWKYGDLDSLVKSRVLPELGAEQYEAWQKGLITNGGEVTGNDADSIAQLIRTTIGRNGQYIEGLDKVLETEDKFALLIDLKDELAAKGRAVGAVHKARGKGEIDPDEAEAQLDQLDQEKATLSYLSDLVSLSKLSTEEVEAGVLFNANGLPTNTTIEAAVRAVTEKNGTDGLEVLGPLQEAYEGYTNANTTDLGKVTVEDTDDFKTTFEIGAYPVGSCQHYESGSFKAGLLGYFEPGSKVIAVKNEKGSLIARSVVRLGSDDFDAPVMVMEPVYTTIASNDVDAAIRSHAQQLAASMNIELLVAEDDEEKVILDNGPKAYLHNQRSPHTYSDMFSGFYSADPSQPRASGRTLKYA